MTNRAIRTIQRANSKRLDEDGNALVRQRRFPQPTATLPSLFRGKPRSQARESDRRRRQIEGGRLGAANGLAAGRK